MKLEFTVRTIRGRWLVTCIVLVMIVAGVASYLWLSWSQEPALILQATRTALAVGLAAEQILRLQASPLRPYPSRQGGRQG